MVMGEDLPDSSVSDRSSSDLLPPTGPGPAFRARFTGLYDQLSGVLGASDFQYSRETFPNMWSDPADKRMNDVNEPQFRFSHPFLLSMRLRVFEFTTE